MPRLLRLIRRSRWEKGPEDCWLPDGTVKADAFLDLRTRENELSLWHLEDDLSNLERLVAAVTAGRDDLSACEYTTIDQSVLEPIGGALRTSRGTSLDADANERWHRDLYNLSGDALLMVAKAICFQGQAATVLPKAVGNMLRLSVAQGHISKERLKPKLAEAL